MSTVESLNSLIGRLQHTKEPELGRALEEIIKHNYPLEQVSNIVEARIDSGLYICIAPLAALVAKGRSTVLYEKLRTRFFEDVWELLKLYKEHYPDPRIETALCQKLYEVASNDAEPRRGSIVRAMKEVGSEAVLPTLEALLYDLGPSAKIQEIFMSSLDLLGGLKATSLMSFVGLLADAIDEIRMRGKTASNTSNNQGGAVMSSALNNQGGAVLFSALGQSTLRIGTDQSSNAVKYKLKALKLIDIDPEAALTYIRKGAESLAKELYRFLGYEKNSKPARRMPLEEILGQLKDGETPEVLKLFLRTLQPFANFGAHDQDGQQSTQLSKELVGALLVLYEQAIVTQYKWLTHQRDLRTADNAISPAS